MTALVLVLLGLAVLALLVGWVVPTSGSRPPAPLLLGSSAAALLVGAAWATTATADVHIDDHGLRALALVLLLAVAVAGGAVVILVFALVGRGEPDPPAGSEPPDGPDQPDGPDERTDGVEGAGAILRGGSWIGALERAAVFATLVTGWPEGLLAVVGLKGLGRYPELRSQERPGVAERFIIGTFASVLWAAACAGLARELT